MERMTTKEVAAALRKLGEGIDGTATSESLFRLADQLDPEAKAPVIFTTTLPFYTDADLKHPSFVAIVAEAKELWKKRIAEHVAKHGDRGTCVLGAGFTVEVKHTGKRKPVAEDLIYPGEVTGVQGSVCWESSVPEVKAFLESRGLKVRYNYGSMD